MYWLNPYVCVVKHHRLKIQARDPFVASLRNCSVFSSWHRLHPKWVASLLGNVLAIHQFLSPFLGQDQIALIQVLHTTDFLTGKNNIKSTVFFSSDCK